ncbi:MAG: ABC transporter ATP-binding protein [Clostridia bacterium]|nr:ABC transporter ATP-binding protein [Clostridia bacterium]
MEAAVTVSHLTKQYKLYSSPLRRITDSIFGRKSYQEFTALDDVDLVIPKGEVVGILGKNGSGKSTLLKIITGVTRPTSGHVEVDGRIAAMLELTAGFDPELTGIENIFLKALSMGIPQEEIRKKLPDIIAFADIGEHIHEPVRTYSSGMKSRLGFAVSVHVDPDILVVDEVLAVGDDVFRLKCIERMKEFRQQGKTILFVSHSLFTVKAFCTKGLWLKEGKQMAYGDLGPVMREYELFLKEEKAKTVRVRRAEGDDSPVSKSDILAVRKVKLLNEVGEETDTFTCGEDVTVSFEYEVKRPIGRLNFGITLRDADEREIFLSERQKESQALAAEPGKHTLTITIKKPNLLNGRYLLSGELWDNDSTFYVGFCNKRPFTMVSESYLGSGIVRFEYEFQND